MNYIQLWENLIYYNDFIYKCLQFQKKNLNPKRIKKKK